MLFAIGKKVEVYDNRDNVRDWKTAVIESVRTQVKSSFDSHIYPLLYDVKFLHDSHHSKGHLPFAVRQIEQCTVRRSGLILCNREGVAYQ